VKIRRTYILRGFLGACAAATLALLLWPQSTPPAAVPSRPQPYRGPAFDARQATRLTAFPYTFGDGQAAPVASSTAVPTLVGIAGSAVYLRGSTGEATRVLRGEEIDGWKLVSVRGRTAVIRGPGGDRTLALFERPSEPAANGDLSPAEN
jgi:hypothetical protein